MSIEPVWAVKAGPVIRAARRHSGGIPARLPARSVSRSPPMPRVLERAQAAVTKIEAGVISAGASPAAMLTSAFRSLAVARA